MTFTMLMDCHENVQNEEKLPLNFFENKKSFANWATESDTQTFIDMN